MSVCPKSHRALSEHDIDELAETTLGFNISKLAYAIFDKFLIC